MLMHHTKNKQAFSFVEIIISVSIIVLLTVVTVWINSSYKDSSYNTQIVSGTETIKSSIESFLQENSSLPMPWWNNNFFTTNGSYTHSFTWSNSFWVYGSFTQNSIPKKYLDILPLDPRSNAYFSYWKTNNSIDVVANQFEVAWVLKEDWTYLSKVIWNYSAEVWPYNLIREYNWPNFVYDSSKENLPYNPEELILTVKDQDGKIYREWDMIITAEESKELYFSDGSVSILEPNSELTLNKLNFPNNDNLNTVVKLALGAGAIWTKATKLNDESEFEVYTTDSSAAVRGTVFWVSKLTNATDVLVVEWEVDVFKNDEEKTYIKTLTKDEAIRVSDWVENGTSQLDRSSFDTLDENASTYEDTRGDGVVLTWWEESSETIDNESSIEIVVNDETDESEDDTSTCNPSSTTEGNLITSITCDSDWNEVISYDCIEWYHIQDWTDNICEKDVIVCNIGNYEWEIWTDGKCSVEFVFNKWSTQTIDLWNKDYDIYINQNRLQPNFTWNITIKWKDNNNFYIKNDWELWNIYTNSFSSNSQNLKITDD